MTRDEHCAHNGTATALHRMKWGLFFKHIFSPGCTPLCGEMRLHLLKEI